MIRSVDFISQTEVEMMDGAPRQSDVALISIATPGALPPRLPPFVEVLPLAFHDVEEHEEPWFVFNDEHARSILEFVARIHGAEKAWRCIVHCKAGISRSAAVALYVAKATGCEFLRRQEADAANLLVLNVLSRASGLQLQPAYRQIMRLLFLDFDGVLHPVDAINRIEHEADGVSISGNRLIRHAPRLHALLEDYPDVAVVISSDWRNYMSLEELRKRLGVLGDRVIGTTSHTALSGVAAYSLETSGLTRYRQCERLADHFGVDSWCLLDDHADIVFGPERPTPEMMRRVIFCDPIMGLDTLVTVGRLEKWLAG